MALNKYLRELKILSLDDEAFREEWKMKFTSTLLKHLSQIPKHKGTTWRGITYDPKI